MVKKIVSLTMITILLSFTAVIPLGVNCGFSYADESDPTPEEIQSAAICTYFNSRNGYFVSTSSVGVVALLKRYITEFYESDSNNTGINSTIEFISHVSINNNGSYGVILDQTAINFLDNLTKWLLGKNEFPELHSGGSWGTGSNTNDSLYDGKLIGNNLFYILKTGSSPVSTSPNLYNSSDVKIGTPVNGITGNLVYKAFQNYVGNIDFNNTSVTNYVTYTYGTIEYSSDISKVLKVQRVNGNGANNPSLNVVDGNYPYTYGYLYSSRVNKNIGCPAWYLFQDEAANTYHYGYVTYNETVDKYSFLSVGTYYRSDNVNNVSISFQTDNFNKNDQENTSDPEATTTYTPKYTEDGGDTYNTYNDNNTTSTKQFITKYINNYITKTTIINKDSSDDQDPEQPTNPGGTIPDWSNTGSGDGTLTPDGNGGFNLHFPDFNLPDLNIDWSINGLSEKFPFSIPFDLMAFFAVLNAEPETPELAGSIDLGLVQWDIDWDLHDFDNTASILRNLEFIGFCIALILITRRIIKG